METRDKLFTEEQYVKQLKMYDEDISYYEQMHLSGKHIGYDSLFNYRLSSIIKILSIYLFCFAGQR